MISKNNAFSRSNELISKLLGLEKAILIKLITGVFLGNLLLFTIPFFLQFLVNYYLNLNLEYPIVIICLIVFLILLVAYSIFVFNTYLCEILCRKFFIKTFYRILDHLETFGKNDLPSAQYSRFLEITPASENITNLIIDLSRTLIILLIGSLIIVLYHPYYLFYCLSFIAIITGIFFVSFPYALSHKSHLSDIKFKINEKIFNQTTFDKNQIVSGQAEAYFKRMSKSYLRISSSYFRILLYKNLLIAFLIPLSQALFIFISAKLIFEGTLSVGQFVSAEVIVTYILASVHSLAKNIDKILSVIVNLDKIESLMTKKQEVI